MKNAGNNTQWMKTTYDDLNKIGKQNSTTKPTHNTRKQNWSFNGMNDSDEKTKEYTSEEKKDFEIKRL